MRVRELRYVWLAVNGTNNNISVQFMLPCVVSILQINKIKGHENEFHVRNENFVSQITGECKVKRTTEKGLESNIVTNDLPVLCYGGSSILIVYYDLRKYKILFNI